MHLLGVSDDRRIEIQELEKGFTAVKHQREVGTGYFDVISEIVSQAHPDAALYRQLNLYAHERFPHNLAFVRNLLSAYSRPGTENPAAWEAVIRQYWFNALA